MKSILLMMTSVFMFSLYPLLAALGLERNDPVLLVAVAHVACAVTALGYGLVILRRKYGAANIRQHIFCLDRKAWGWVLLTGLASAINHTCLMFALMKTSKIGVTIIYETWPIIALWLMPALVAKGWEKVRVADYAFGLLAVAGIAAIVAGENSAVLFNLDLAALRNADPDRLLGYGLAFVGSAGVAVSTTLRRNVTRHLSARHGDDLLIGATLASALTRTATLPIFALLFLFLYQPGAVTLTLPDLPMIAGMGIGVYLMGTLFYVFSVTRTPNPAVPVPDFLAPIMAVAWLYLFGYDDASDFIIIGGLFVITANLLVTVRAEDGFAYTASIVTLLCGGAFCYFTQGADLENFYEAVAVSAVFYAILIAFAWDRVLERTKHEENLLLGIAYNIEDLRHSLGDTGKDFIRRMVANVRALAETTDSARIGQAYNALRDIKTTLPPQPGLNGIYRDIDSLVLSKTKEVMLSEIVLLCLIGGITFFGILGYRPPGLWPDMMAFIMAGAIVFIFFAIFDQMKARNNSTLCGEGESLCVINDGLFESRHEFKLVTMVLIAIMLAVFYGLFLYKYRQAGG